MTFVACPLTPVACMLMVMDSQHPYSTQPTPQPGNFNPEQFDFITNPVQPKRPGLFSPGGSKERKLMLIAGGLGVLTVVILLFAVLFGGNGSDADKLIVLAQKQQEIIRVAGLSDSKNSTNETQNFAQTSLLTVSSQQQGLIAQIKKTKKVSTATLGRAKNTKTDDTLNAAKSNGRFDDIFVETLKSELAKYQESVKSTYDSISDSTSKELLNNDYDDISLLLGTKSN